MNVDHLEYYECSNRFRNGKTNGFSTELFHVYPRVWKSGGEPVRSEGNGAARETLQVPISSFRPLWQWRQRLRLEDVRPQPHFATNFTLKISGAYLVYLPL